MKNILILVLLIQSVFLNAQENVNILHKFEKFMFEFKCPNGKLVDNLLFQVNVNPIYDNGEETNLYSRLELALKRDHTYEVNYIELTRDDRKRFSEKKISGKWRLEKNAILLSKIGYAELFQEVLHEADGKTEIEDYLMVRFTNPVNITDSKTKRLAPANLVGRSMTYSCY